MQSYIIMKTSIFSHTYRSFSDWIYSILGKGNVHAGLIYEEFFRTGKVTGEDPAFNNAKQLLQAILDLIDTSLPEIAQQISDGATGKFLLRLADKYEVESVLIPMQAGGTLCISSQVGCRMGCAFCETGRMGLLRNLTVEEIISQVFIARHVLGFKIRNIVFMGMGEPFDNYDAVMQAVRILTDPKGFGFGRKNITISTSGRVAEIDRLIAEGDAGPNLAVSINAPTDAMRNKLMPINRKHSMQDLRNAMERYCTSTKRQILAAYVLIKGQNDSLEHADQLADYLQGLDVKVNLIPYNAQSRDRFQSPEPEDLEAFTARVRSRGFHTLLRLTKGAKIMAACGQLGNLELRKTLRTSCKAPGDP